MNPRVKENMTQEWVHIDTIHEKFLFAYETFKLFLQAQTCLFFPNNAYIQVEFSVNNELLFTRPHLP